MQRNVSACILVRTIQNGFVMQLLITPLVEAEAAYRAKVPSSSWKLSRKKFLKPSYMGKYMAWNIGVQKAVTV